MQLIIQVLLKVKHVSKKGFRNLNRRPWVQDSSLSSDMCIQITISVSSIQDRDKVHNELTDTGSVVMVMALFSLLAVQGWGQLHNINSNSNSRGFNCNCNSNSG